MSNLNLIGIVFLVAASFSVGASQNIGEVKEFPKVSVQLWSVRDELSKDFKGTVTQLAEMGFDGVELAGGFGEFDDDPGGLMEFINSQGLEISGAHVSFDSLSDANFEATTDFYSKAGVSTLIVPWDGRASKAETVWQTIADLNRLLPRVEALGMRFGYHNHAQEFSAYRDTTLWDHIARSTPDSLVLQLDVGWVNKSGNDPVEYVKKYPGRTLTTHYKAKLADAKVGLVPLIGQDGIDWPELIRANVEEGGTLWFVLEQEEYPNNLSPLEAVKESKQGLDRLFVDYIQ